MTTALPSSLLQALMVAGGCTLGLGCAPKTGPITPHPLAASTPRSGPNEAVPPNILWIVADDMGWADAGFQGSEVFQTPHLDRLAKEGVRALQGYASSAVCSPSRAGLLTGRYQQRFGHELNLSPGNSQGLPHSELTIAEHLGNHGYRTGLVGKWHLGTTPGREPESHGFHEFYGLLGGSRRYFPVATGTPDHQAMRRGGDVEDLPRGSYVTELLGEEAARFVSEAPEPFFLMLSFTAPHTPMEARSGDRARFAGLPEERATLAAMTYNMDRAVGEVLEALDRRDLRDNTLVAFFGDNGGAQSNHADNYPLRGYKGAHNEGGVRVPFLLRWPARWPAGQECEQPLSTLDLFATACGAAQIPTPLELDGIDLVPLLRAEGTPWPERNLYWRRGRRAAVRHQQWKLLRDKDRLRLYHLDRDPQELDECSQREPAALQRCTQLLSDWERELSAPLWTVERD